MADKQFSTYTSEQAQITEVGDGIIPVANADGLTTKGKINGSDLANDVQSQFNDYAKIYETTADKDADQTIYQEGDIIFDKETKKEYIVGPDGLAGSAVEVVEFGNSINDLINQNEADISALEAEQTTQNTNIATNATDISDLETLTGDGWYTSMEYISFGSTLTSAISIIDGQVKENNTAINGSIDTHSDVDTSTTAPTAGQGLVWNDTTGKWEPADLGSGGAGAFELSGTVIKETGLTGTSSNDFVVGADDPYNTTSGARMFFDTSRAAFRAGYYDDTFWNEANSGYYSTALGYNTIASGDYSIALGSSTTASGFSSTIVGRLGQTNSDTAFAVAYGASGDQDIVGAGLQFEVKQDGRVKMNNLPTSSTGLTAGDLWNNGGVINIV